MTTMADGSAVASFRIAPNHLIEIRPHDPDSIFPTCWWPDCDESPRWDVAHYGCSSSHCGTNWRHGELNRRAGRASPLLPCGTGNHEHYCDSHVVETCKHWRVVFVVTNLAHA